METQSIETALAGFVRSLVRDEVRAALADHRGELRNAAGAVYLSVVKAAEVADVAPGTIRAWIRKRRLPARRAGRVLRIRREDLDAFLERCARGDLAARAEEIRRVG